MLATHLGHQAPGELGELRRDRRYSVARRLAGLFASYAEQRPSILTDWREGRDTDGAGVELPSDLAWQPPLWRALLSRVDAAPPDLRHADVVTAIRAGADLDLPDRLSMFGHTRMPVTQLELLRALSRGPRGARVASAAVAGCLGRAPGRVGRWAGAAQARRQRRAASATGCSPRWVATPASCSGR